MISRLRLEPMRGYTTLSHDSHLASEWHDLVCLVTHRRRQISIKSSTISMRRMLRLSEANDLFLAVGDALKLMDGGSLFPSAYEASYRRAKSLEENTHRVIGEVLVAFKRAGLPLLTIKSFLPFPYVDSNVDLVAVETARIGVYCDVLYGLGYKRRPNLADLREPYKRMYRASDRGKDKTYPMLHLHRAISWNGVEYLNLSTVWQRYRLMDVNSVQIPVPSFEDAILIMAAHAIFENKYVTLKELVYLQWLTERPLDWGYIVRSAESLFWREALDIFLSTALALARVLNLVIDVEVDLPSLRVIPQLPLPYFFPFQQTFAVSWKKLGRDMASGHWRTLARQLFSYFFVDSVWMYRKARRKCRAVTKIV
jgi:hypothetical protein